MDPHGCDGLYVEKIVIVDEHLFGQYRIFQMVAKGFSKN